MSICFFVCELTQVQKKLLTQMKMVIMISGDNGDNAKLRLGGFGVRSTAAPSAKSKQMTSSKSHLPGTCRIRQTSVYTSVPINNC